MDEYLRGNRNYYKDKPGYEGHLNWKVAALSEILQDAGYQTMMSGKWHLGYSKDLAPCSRGFDKNFTFLPGAGNHYAWEPQLADGQKHPPCIKTRDFWMKEDGFIDMFRDLPKDFYSTTSFTDQLLEYLRERDETAENPNQEGSGGDETGKQPSSDEKSPFFAYLALTAPHWPLQAARDVMKKYGRFSRNSHVISHLFWLASCTNERRFLEGLYDDGPDALTQTRLKRMKELGIVEKDVVSAPPVGLVGKDWTHMTSEERKVSARKMEAFAAMVELIDINMGRVIEYLEASEELDNTFILFMSDNGAEGAMMEAVPVRLSRVSSSLDVLTATAHGRPRNVWRSYR